MPLQPGSKLGTYEILSSIGSGGMGEVYRARDVRLNREVAIKTIRAGAEASEESIRRFEQEARSLAALNHPNLLAIYDVGTEDGVAYLVSELLEGETLRERLQQGSIPFRKALEYATQIVRALVAAHDRGLVHRDLKPENIFLTRDGQVKLLDFGLAKLIQRKTATGAAMSGDGTTITVDAGKTMGTPGYMSPEQLRGQAVDYRSDIFSFGAVLHEMLCGRRVFGGTSTVDIVAATLNEEPQDLTEINPSVPPATAIIIRHCLEKRPEDRFQSARDLLFDLNSLATTSSASGSTTKWHGSNGAKQAKPVKLWWAAGAAVVLAVLAALATRLLWPSTTPLPTFTQLTFHRSSISYARFTGDGNTVLYNASWAERPVDIFSTRLGSTESHSLGILNADLLSVSPKGELLVLINRQDVDPWFYRGTLARVPMLGGSPKEIAEDVQSADWAPNGNNIAASRQVKQEQVLEYPLGKPLFHTQGWITDVRVSPHGDQVAFMEHGTINDDRGWVWIVDSDGKSRRLTEEFTDERGLAWAPDGKAVWFTATETGGPYTLYRVTLRGKSDVRFRAPVSLQLLDVAQDGSALLSSHKDLRSVVFLPAGQSVQHDLSWLDQISLFDMSADGKNYLFQYFGEGGGPNYTTYVGSTDGSPPVRIGEGAGVALSPDGKWVIAHLFQTHQVVLLPTGAGQVRYLQRPGLEDIGEDAFTPDSQSVLFTAFEPGHPSRCYIQDIDGGKPRPFCPEGVTRARMSPDGKWLVARQGRRYVVLRTDGTDVRPIDGIVAHEQLLRWSGDSKALYVSSVGQPMRLYRLDPFNGRKELIREINPLDPAGIIGYPVLFASADGKNVLYTFLRNISELYLVKNLAQ